MHTYLHLLDKLLHVSTCAYVSQVCSCAYLCVTAYVGYARQARYVFLCTGEKPPNCVHVCLCVCQATSVRLCPVESFRSMSMSIEVVIHLQRSETMLAQVVACCLQYMKTWKTWPFWLVMIQYCQLQVCDYWNYNHDYLPIQRIKVPAHFWVHISWLTTYYTLAMAYCVL